MSDTKRDSWGHSFEFGLTLVGYAVGLTNIIRFPYVVFRNGGGSFLVPYFTCLFLCGMPLYYLEMAMGQSTRKSCIACWDYYAPALKGIGYAMVIMNFVASFVYQAYLSWIIHYIGASLISIVKWDLPWKTCNATWNTDSCVVTIGDMKSNYSEVLLTTSANSTASKSMTAAEEYWQNYVLKLSDGINNVGYPSWQLCVTHVISWIVLYLCLRKSIRSVGKVVWVTATLPYLLITIFLVRAVLLPGSLEGIKFYLTPDFQTLKDPEVWMMGFLQIFYTLGPGWGGLIAMSSFNDIHHKFQREAFLVPLMTCLTSFYSGFVIFSCAGFMAHKSGLPVREVMSSGPGLTFITYPEVTTHLPGGPIWALLFFLMMLMVGIDTMFMMIETCVSAIKDEIPRRFKNVPLWFIVVCNIPLGVLLLTNGGMYIFQLIEWYYAVLVAFLAATLEALTLIWLYRYDRLSNDIKTLVGAAPSPYVAVPLCGVIIPVLLMIAMIWSIVNLTPPVYGAYTYPDWCPVVGWFIAILVISPVPLFVVGKLISLRYMKWRDMIYMMWRPSELFTVEDEFAMKA